MCFSQNRKNALKKTSQICVLWHRVVRLCCNVVALADGAVTLQMDNIVKRSVRVCFKGC